MSDRPLLVGQAPARRGDAGPFLDDGQPARRLRALLSVSADGLRARARLENLLMRYPGRVGAGDAFPLREARAGWARILAGGLPPRTLLIGFGVARAAGLGHLCPLVWHSLGGGEVAIVPHPSGRNRWWNDPAQRDVAAAFLRTALSGSEIPRQETPS